MPNNQVNMTVNGEAVSADLDPRTLLVHFLREQLRLTGTHVGCDTSQCGACTVHIDGTPIKSCTIFAVQLDGADVITIEGVGAFRSGPAVCRTKSINIATKSSRLANAFVIRIGAQAAQTIGRNCLKIFGKPMRI